MLTTPQPRTDDEEDVELEVADWIDQQNGEKSYSVGSSRSITLR